MIDFAGGDLAYYKDEPGLEHQVAMPEMADPDTLPSEADIEARYGAMMPPALKASEAPV